MYVVTDLDHVVLRVADVEASLAWYCERLGLEAVRVEEWRSGTAPFPSVRISRTAIIDLVAAPSSGVNLDHFCLVVAPCDLAAEASAAGVEVYEGPVGRFGACGQGTSIYLRDPDGNVVELRHYG